MNLLDFLKLLRLTFKLAFHLGVFLLAIAIDRLDWHKTIRFGALIVSIVIFSLSLWTWQSKNQELLIVVGTQEKGLLSSQVRTMHKNEIETTISELQNLENREVFSRDLYFNLRKLHQALGQTDQADFYAKKMLEIDPEFRL